MSETGRTAEVADNSVFGNDGGWLEGNVHADLPAISRHVVLADLRAERGEGRCIRGKFQPRAKDDRSPILSEQHGRQRIARRRDAQERGSYKPARTIEIVIPDRP